MTQYGIQKLSNRHHQIVRLALKGLAAKDIAQQTTPPMTVTMVKLVLNSPTFQHELAVQRSLLNAETRERINDGEDQVLTTLQKGALQAARRLCDNTIGEDASIANKAAAEVLDRAGYGRVSKLESKSVSAVINISSDDARAINETLQMLD